MFIKNPLTRGFIFIWYMKLHEQLRRIKKIMAINEQVKEFNEVADNVYNLIEEKYSDSRLIMTDNNIIEFKSVPIDEQKMALKPRGLWYGIGPSWIDWVRSEMPDWEVDNVFKIDVDETKLLTIRTIEELDAFDEKYGSSITSYFRNIDWGKVASEYGGIEIAPYIYKGRFKYIWYYGWDVASGCIWDDGVITNIEKLND